MSDTEALDQLQTIGQIIDRAQEVTGPGAFAWAATGAGEGVTTTRNRVALNSLALVPRFLHGVETADISTSFMGVPLALPVLLAPVGALAVYDDGDAVGAASAATTMGTSAMCATLTTSAWEDVAGTGPGRHFFQLYVFGDRSWMTEVLTRISDAGFAGICITVDTAVVSRRDHALESGFSWNVHDDEDGAPNLNPHGSDTSYRARFTWDDLHWLCENSPLPVAVKGLLTAEDATRAVECGAAGIYVSNHGGRAVDHAISSIEVLGEIVEAVGTSVDVIIDGGFTRGPEVVKALALGARAVGIGRLQCWGLAAGGEAGLVRVLEILRMEIASTTANMGCHTIDDLAPRHVRWSMSAWPNHA